MHLGITSGAEAVTSLLMFKIETPSPCVSASHILRYRLNDPMSFLSPPKMPESQTGISLINAALVAAEKSE